MRSGPLDRFDIRPLLREHFRSLRRVQLNVDEGALKPDLTARVVLYGLPVSVGAVAFWQDWQLTDPGSIGAGCGLMAGILFLRRPSVRVLLADVRLRQLEDTPRSPQRPGGPTPEMRRTGIDMRARTAADAVAASARCGTAIAHVTAKQWLLA